ncbi:MAG: ABC transporter ATP-binding protein/permease [Treponema sp.]|nr:ABC transporter ATP-binding protein/permease [Treponema sp.]
MSDNNNRNFPPPGGSGNFGPPQGGGPGGPPGGGGFGPPQGGGPGGPPPQRESFGGPVVRQTLSATERPRTRRPPGPGGPGGGPMGFMMGGTARDFKGTMRRLLVFIKPYIPQFILIGFLTVLATILQILGPRINGMVIDELFNGAMAQMRGTGSINFVRIAQIISWLIWLFVVGTVFQFIQGWVMSGISANLTYRFRDDLSRKIHRLPFTFFDGTTHGEILSRITNDVDTVTMTLNTSINQVITSACQLLGIIAIMCTINWPLTVASLALLSLSFLVVRVIIKHSQVLFRTQQTYLGQVNSHVEEMFSAHTVVKAFSGEVKSVETFNESNDVLYNAAWRANFISGLMMPLNGLIGNIIFVGICIAGGALAVQGRMTLGGIQAFTQYVRQLSQPINQIAQVTNMLQQTAAAAERVFEFLEQPEEVPETAEPLSTKGIAGQVTFDHVGFGYDPSVPVIKDFSAEVKTGQKIAIVGPTGAGKTTIVKLLMRFYDADRGSIAIDGHDIKLFTRDDLRHLFGMVLQDTWLFNGTIRENIRYGRLNATDAEVEEAAKAAQVDFFVHTWPEGYNMELNEETSNISQGQKQLLTIARAILADPGMLILDEATSSVDTRTEGLIQTAMDNLMKGRTSFVIAHRLSTIRNADLILAIQDGDIVEQGTHAELLDRGGFYAALYNSQFEGAEEAL